MNGSSTAKRDQDEVARVEPAIDGDQFDLVGHVLVRGIDDSMGCHFHRFIRLRAQSLSDRARAARGASGSRAICPPGSSPG